MNRSIPYIYRVTQYTNCRGLWTQLKFIMLFIPTIKPYSALLATSHCTLRRKVSARSHVGSASPERVGQGKVGRVTHRVLCTWWLLGLAVKESWLGPGGPPLTLTAWTGLENTTLTL